MASDKSRALIAIVKVLIAAVAGYGLYYFWSEARVGLDEWYVPYGAGIIVAVVVFLLLSKFSKGSGD